MEKSKKTKTSVGVIIGVAVSLVVYLLAQQYLFIPPTFDKVMMKMASEMNESCPIMIDQATRLDNVAALPDNTLQYNYTLIGWVKDSVDLNAFEAYMQPMLLNQIKTNPDLKIYRDHETTLAYSYKDMNGAFIQKFSISADMYLDKQ